MLQNYISNIFKLIWFIFECFKNMFYS